MKGWVIHFFVGCMFGLFGWEGVINVFFFFLGMEVTQAIYRSFSDGYRWSDLYGEPWIVLRYLPAKKGGWIDTLLDLLLPVIGASIAASLRSVL